MIKINLFHFCDFFIKFYFNFGNIFLNKPSKIKMSMKKILLSIAAASAFLAISNSASAQSVFTVRYEDTSDTIKTIGTGENPSQAQDLLLNTHLDIANDIDTFTYQWQIKELSLPAGWSLQGFCDNITCYTGTSVMLNAPYAPSPESDPVHVVSGINDPIGKLYPWIHAPLSTAAKGVGVLKLELKTMHVVSALTPLPEQVAELLYIVEKTTDPVSVHKIVVDETSFVVYPNPATKNITIYAASKLNASKVLFTDVLGRTVLTKAIANNQTANVIDIESLQAGAYNVSIVDANGKIISSKKVSIL